jgi:hypothetical protein
MQQAAQEGRQVIEMRIQVIARQFTSTLCIKRWGNMATNCPQEFPAVISLEMTMMKTTGYQAKLTTKFQNTEFRLHL